MNGLLRDALEVGRREVVVFVGAGGKTTTMFRLARELWASSAGVVVTTTTKIFLPVPDPDLAAVVDDRLDRLVAAADAVLARGQMVVLGRGMTAQSKLAGLPPEWIGVIAAARSVTHMLVEGDGAAGKPFTAPRDHEPVIPGSATLVVPVVGADALHQPLSFEVAHRPERVAVLTGLAAGERIDARTIATVLLHPLGNTRGLPGAARIVPLVNKADSPDRLAAARQIAAELRRQGAGRVVIAAVAGSPPVVEVVT